MNFRTKLRRMVNIREMLCSKNFKLLKLLNKIHYFSHSKCSEIIYLANIPLKRLLSITPQNVIPEETI